MNASIPAALLMLLLAGGWWFGRRRSRPFLRSTDTTAVADLNRAQIERLQALAPAPAAEPGSLPQQLATVPEVAAALPVAFEETCRALPLDAGERGRCLRLLQGWMTGSREQRLQALAIACQSTRRDVLPLLRLGLRDPDPAVMAAAAAGIARFRGRSTASQPTPQTGETRNRRLAQPAGAAMSRPRSVCRTR